MQTPGTYNLPWQQGWMGATNQINDIPAAGGQDIVAQNKTESEPQSQIGAGQNYTDQVLRMQQLQQPSTVINGIASTDNTTEVSVVNQPKQVPGKQTYTKAEVQFTSASIFLERMICAFLRYFSEVLVRFSILFCSIRC